jgi:hypothetical protein
MFEWVSTLWHAYPTTVGCAIFLLGYWAGYAAKSEGRPFWS